jgi:Leucine-rich repeat (LRR) protein
MPPSTYYAVLLALVLGVGCGKKPLTPLTKEQSAKVIEAAIRKAAEKPTGELTEADLEKVVELQLFGNQLTDVTGLEKCTQLQVLGLGGNQLTELPTGLEKLTQLKDFRSQFSELTDVKGLDKLARLKKLYLGYNKLTSVRGLEKLTQLTELNLEDNPDLTKAQIAELQKALPKCEIFSNPTK